MATNALPSVSQLREIVRLLAFDTDQIPLQGMTTDRQQTALAATAATVLLAKLNNHPPDNNAVCKSYWTTVLALPASWTADAA
jgi:hypothetical protein